MAKEKDVLDIEIGCEGLEVKHFQSGIVLSIKGAEILDIVRYPELADAFKEFAHITDRYR